MDRPRVDNGDIADTLDRIADLLEAQDANLFRVRAYRAGARTARQISRSLIEILEDEGLAGLERLPAIGSSIASLISELAHTGRVVLLDRLEGQVSPEDLFSTVPGIGDELAERIHRELGIETLEELELAAHDGRLERVTGFGERRVRGVRDALAGILGRGARRRRRRLQWLASRAEGHGAGADRPAIATLLALDAEYRRRAEAGELRTIAPRRFNPERRAWLPVLHAERDGWSMSALYSNTARAHELGTTRDWVVIYYEHDGHEGQCTVVSERSGPLRQRRVVRGRESECAEYYAARAPSSPATRRNPMAAAHLTADEQEDRPAT
ncbi:MAG: DNA-binding protein [Deltaproteobacteria bacterium]|nr:MAG: DNA-binding protein [Deltaproteobacteria bacterium]